MPLPNFDNLPTLSPDLIERLLAADELATQATLLREANLLHANGLAALLEEADRLAGDDPRKTWRLAALAVHIADEADAPAVHPRAAYLRGYVHAMRGQFAEAREMVETAQAGYEELGMALEALRTNVGLMRILIQGGEFQSALGVGERAFNRAGKLTGLAQGSIDQLLAFIHQNRGICLGRMGQHQDAIMEYEAAERYFRQLNMPGHIANIADNQGLILLAQGRFQQAFSSFERARLAYQAAQLPLFEAGTLMNLGELFLWTGNYIQSLDSFEKAQEIYDRVDKVADYNIFLRHVGDAYLALNLYGEALDAYRQTIPFLAEANLTHQLGQALWSQGVVFAALRRFPEAQQTFEQAVDIFRAQQNPQLLSAVLLEQSALATQMADAQAAAALAQEALDLLGEGDYPVQQVYARLRNAELSLASTPPGLTRAERLLREAEPLVAALDIPQLRYRTQGLWGQLHRQRGSYAEAEQALTTAIDEIEALRRTLVHERMRASFLNDKLSIYQELISLYLERNETVRAFEIAERAKSRALADLLSGAIQVQLEAVEQDGEGGEGGGGEEGGQARQLRALQAELDAIYNKMLDDDSALADDDEPRVRTVAPTLLKARAVTLEQRIGRLQLQGSVASGARSWPWNGSWSPDSPLDSPLSDSPIFARPLTNVPTGDTPPADIPSGDIPSGDTPPADIPSGDIPSGDIPSGDIPSDDTALLIYHIIGSEILAFVQVKGKTRVLRRLCTVEEVEPSLRRLAVQWSRFQAGQRFAQRHQQQMERSVQRVLGELYEMLMRRIVELLEADERIGSAQPGPTRPDRTQADYVGKLAVVPHGLLHQLPFHALYDGERYLLERCAISYAPSATIFALTQQRSLTLHGQPLVMGVPDARIPAAAAEVEQVMAHLRARQLVPQALVGEAATLGRLRNHEHGGLLHLACHGLFRDDNPMFSALKLHDGWLTANEAAQLKLPASLVTLSACESGRSGRLNSSEILGLPYAFLSAGATSLLVSQWLVQDDVAALFMGEWYAQLTAGADLAEALRQTQLQVKARYPHPYYWAPFLLVGKRRID